MLNAEFSHALIENISFDRHSLHTLYLQEVIENNVELQKFKIINQAWD